MKFSNKNKKKKIINIENSHINGEDTSIEQYIFTIKSQSLH